MNLGKAVAFEGVSCFKDILRLMSVSPLAIKVVFLEICFYMKFIAYLKN